MGKGVIILIILLLLAQAARAQVIPMSDNMREAFGQVARVEVMEGIVALEDGFQLIKCRARGNGMVWEITCHWMHGLPWWINYKLVGMEA